MTITLSMEQWYRRSVCGCPNSKMRVTKTRYPYATKFRGLVIIMMLAPCLSVLMLPGTKSFLSDIVAYVKKELYLRTGYPFKTICRKVSLVTSLI